jgi:beta-phosphoglucomutase-like phosphatase (HAD superfamily)
MGFNRRKLEDQHRLAAEKEAAARRATDAQVLEDAERLIAGWNERQEKRMPMLFSPTIGAAIAAGFWFLWVRCPACRTINAIDLPTLDRHRDAAVTSLIPALSCRACPHRRIWEQLDESLEAFEKRVEEEAKALHQTSGLPAD